MGDRLFVLIGSNNTGPGRRFVRATRNLGLKPIMLVHDPALFDHISADAVDAIQVDTDDAGAVIDACERLGSMETIAGIAAPVEASVDMAATVCQHFRLPGPNPTAIAQCRNKYTQLRVLSEAGVPVPAFGSATNAADAARVADEIGFPVVVKPITGTGSVGVRLCCSTREVADHVAFLLANKQGQPSAPLVLVEEFVTGSWCSVETLNGEVIGTTGGTLSDPPHFTFRHYIFPAQMTREDSDRAAAVTTRALQALALHWGAASTELRFSRLGPLVIEVNPRLNGGVIPRMIELAFGIDLTREVIKLFLGHAPTLRRVRDQVCVTGFLMPTSDGVLEQIASSQRALDVPYVVDVELNMKPGAIIARQGNYRDRLGHVIAVSPDYDRTMAAIDRACALMAPSIVPSQMGLLAERLG